MKLMTFAIPCYNSESYISRCLDTILSIKEDIEIIIINDGSMDNTKKIAESYRKKYPKIIKIINQGNQGHGEGVNQGLKYAEGLYFKVVDSDDWVDEDSLQKLIDQIKIMQDNLPDMFIVNYVYEKEGKSKVINYKYALPKNKIFTWNDVKHFKLDQNIIMHSVVYKTEVLKNCGIVLPKNIFYVDNIFVYYPLPHVKTMYYMDIDFYRYFIGRNDQSVNEKVMVKRIDQQIFVTKEMTKFFDPYGFYDRPKLSKYLIHYLSMMYSICFILAILAKDETKKDDLLMFLKKSNYRLYKHVKNHSLATLTRLPNVILLPGYKIVRKIYKFN